MKDGGGDRQGWTRGAMTFSDMERNPSSKETADFVSSWLLLRRSHSLVTILHVRISEANVVDRQMKAEHRT